MFSIEMASTSTRSAIRHRWHAAVFTTGVALATALPAPAIETARVSIDSAGIELDNHSLPGAISRRGQIVVFSTRAATLVTGDTNEASDVVVHDRKTRATTVVSLTPDGVPGNDFSGVPKLDGTGRRVVFVSRASDLVQGDTNLEQDVFLHDRKSGVTTRVNLDNSGNQANGGTSIAVPSGNGRIVAFDSGATNLVDGDTNAFSDIFVRDLKTGVTTRVSVNGAGGQTNNDNILSVGANLDTRGRYIPFISLATNLVPADINGRPDAFVHDRKTGAVYRVSVDSAGNEANGSSADVTTAGSGRFVAFTSIATNLVPDDSNGTADVFVHDRKTGATTRVSVDSTGAQGNGGSAVPSLSTDGRFVVFQSNATNLVTGDLNGHSDIFVHDRKTGETRRISQTHLGLETDGPNFFPTISGSGRFITYGSSGANLVHADVNGRDDVFVHDRKE